MPDHKRPILDTMVLQGFSFATANSLDILLIGLEISTVFCPEQIYNCDEDQDAPDQDLSEFARGIRFFRRGSQLSPSSEANRYKTCLQHCAAQLPGFIDQQKLRIEKLEISDLLERERLELVEQVDPGEAACLALARRTEGSAIFVSSDSAACDVAEKLGVQIITTFDILMNWIRLEKPNLETLDQVLIGLQQARFGFDSKQTALLKKQRI